MYTKISYCPINVYDYYLTINIKIINNMRGWQQIEWKIINKLVNVNKIAWWFKNNSLLKENKSNYIA